VGLTGNHPVNSKIKPPNSRNNWNYSCYFYPIVHESGKAVEITGAYPVIYSNYGIIYKIAGLIPAN